MVGWSCQRCGPGPRVAYTSAARWVVGQQRRRPHRREPAHLQEKQAWIWALDLVWIF